MDEDPSYRPKIFHSTGPLMGQEQEYSSLENSNFSFPEPNNARRKLRSIACARQIGSTPPSIPQWGHTDFRIRTFSTCCDEKDGSLNDFSLFSHGLANFVGIYTDLPFVSWNLL